MHASSTPSTSLCMCLEKCRLGKIFQGKSDRSYLPIEERLVLIGVQSLVDYRVVVDYRVNQIPRDYSA